MQHALKNFATGAMNVGLKQFQQPTARCLIFFYTSRNVIKRAH